jgi:hypothetical protein
VVNAGVNALNYTPAWQTRVSKLQKAQKRDMRDAKLATARKLLGYENADEVAETDDGDTS